MSSKLGAGARRNDNGIGMIFFIAGMNGERPLRKIDRSSRFEFAGRAETRGLPAQDFHHFRALNSMFEAGIILDFGGDGKLSAGLIAFEHDRRKISAGRVERGRQPCRAGTDDEYLMNFVAMKVGMRHEMLYV